MTDWLRGFDRRDLGPDGGRYDIRRNPKILLHTTEGSTLGGAERAFRPYPPHVGVDPHRRIRRQYIRLDRHSYSLAGGESDDEYVIQVEIVGFARNTDTWGDGKLRWLGEQVLAPIMAAIDCPPRIPAAGFLGEGSGIILASPNSPIRFSLAEFRRFSGVCGHQHAPAPDSHWDPGALNVRKILAYATEEDDMSWDESLALWAPKPYDPESRDRMTAGQQLNQARGFAHAAYELLRELRHGKFITVDLAGNEQEVSLGYALRNIEHDTDPARIRKAVSQVVEAPLREMSATIATLAADRGQQVDVDELVARIEAAIEQVSVRLEVEDEQTS